MGQVLSFFLPCASSRALVGDGLLFIRFASAFAQLQPIAGGKLETMKSQDHIHLACCKIKVGRVCCTILSIKVCIVYTWPIQNRIFLTLPPLNGPPGLPEMIECRLVVVEIFGRGLACFLSWVRAGGLVS